MSRSLGLALGTSALSLCMFAGLAAGQNTDLVSIRPNNNQANNFSQGAHVTPDGRFVAFYSLASTLVSGDSGGFNDVFVMDRKLNTMVRVSVPDPSMPDTQGNGGSRLNIGQSRVMSDNGRFVIFTSDADNLVANDTNGVADVFVRDRDLDGNGIFDEPGVGKTKTSRVSLSSGEGQGNGPCPNQICDHYSENGVISANGRYVAWQSQYGFTAEGAPYTNVYWRDRDADNDGIMDEAGGSPDAAVTKLASKRISTSFQGQTGDGFSQNPAISADGRWVTFESVSRFMVFSDSTSNMEIFARDMISGSQNIRITEPTAGGQPDADSGNSTVSANGRFVAFSTGANNLTSVNAGVLNIVIKDRDTDNDGIFDEAGAISFTNASVGYNAFALPDGVVLLNGSSFRPSISDDGSLVAFDTVATNFLCSTIGGCTDTNATSDILVYNRLTNRTTRASVRYDGAQANGVSQFAALSPNGRFVGFRSDDATLEPVWNGGPYTHAYVRALSALAHDSCNDALPLPAVNLTYFGDTWGSTWSGDVLCQASTLNSPAQWYSYTANCTGQLTINTQGSSFDTVLSVFNAPCPATANKGVACNDDFSGMGFQSQVTLNVTQGQTYIIRVSGWNFASGLLQLHINACQPACVADVDDGSGTGTPDNGVTIDDLLYYLQIFEAGSINADVDDGSGTGTLDGGVTIDDLLYFLQRFEAGC